MRQSRLRCPHFGRDPTDLLVRVLQREHRAGEIADCRGECLDVGQRRLTERPAVHRHTSAVRRVSVKSARTAGSSTFAEGVRGSVSTMMISTGSS